MAHEIETFVFFDIETTGLPWQEKNQTKIIEISFVAVQRQDIVGCHIGSIPKVEKLTFILNPQRSINRTVSAMTGLKSASVKNAPTFKEKFESINTFLKKLTQPTCLVAHNGNLFDFKILLAECNDICMSLPRDLLCIDSLVAFRRILREITNTNTQRTEIKDDIDEWPELDLSSEDWKVLDDLCQMNEAEVLKSDSENSVAKKVKTSKKKIKKRDEVIKDIFNSKADKKSNPNSFTLSSVYEQLLNKEAIGAHRAENDCLMLLECFIALKKDILSWTDNNCKPLYHIEPLIRYR